MVDFIGSEIFEFHGFSDLCGVCFVWALLKAVYRSLYKGHKDGESQRHRCNTSKSFKELHGCSPLNIQPLSKTPVSPPPPEGCMTSTTSLNW